MTSRPYTTIDEIIEDLYTSVSFGPHMSPDHARFRALFAPGASILPPADDEIVVTAISVDDFIETSREAFTNSPQLEESGFQEKEIHRVVQQFASIAQVFSTYEAQVPLEDGEAVSRGVNSIQLAFQSGRWWIVSLSWDDESPQTPLPADFTP